jgi:hypothetical protein
MNGVMQGIINRARVVRKVSTKAIAVIRKDSPNVDRTAGSDEWHELNMHQYILRTVCWVLFGNNAHIQGAMEDALLVSLDGLHADLKAALGYPYADIAIGIIDEWIDNRAKCPPGPPALKPWWL